MKENLNKHHLYSLDFLKFMAALMITNSHFQPVYEDVSTSLATFGVHGNALFFFVAGYLLMMGFDKYQGQNVVDWYKARIRRLWPSVFLWAIVAAAIWNVALTIPRLVLMDGYWFLQAIAVAYLFFYILAKPIKRIGGRLSENYSHVG
ncbi:acyltransferase family protein [Prevotella pectinovora]|uniref:acyltransferase family protein n=1 Tax=Prevotella pectinovora TaxID=1602169 RepID=UPI000698BD5B|nr:acyltransferase family protein [Prevotella pectinovora]